MLQGFEKIHYLAYSFFFLGKIMFIITVGALYSGCDNPLPFAFAYVMCVFVSFSLGLYDQWRTAGFGLNEHKITWDVLAPVEKTVYSPTWNPTRRKRG